MLGSTELKSLIASGEGYNLEFKKNIPNKIKEITEEVCAFANAAGGTLLIGIDDNNNIQGISFDNATRSRIQNSINEITPNLHCEVYPVEIEGKLIVMIEVPSGGHKPYVLSGAIYVRQGPNSQKLTTVEEMRDFFQQANRIYFDEAPCKEVDIVQDVSDGNIEQFKALAELGSTRSVLEDVHSKLSWLQNSSELFTALAIPKETNSWL